MADTELHIHIPGPFDVSKLDGLLNEAIALVSGSQETKQVVPVGYHCVECYANDGSHAVTCSIYKSHKDAIKP